MDEFEKIVKMCSDLMTMNDNLMNMNKELIAKVQSQGNDKKFEQATTPDGIPQWEYKTTGMVEKDYIEKLGKEGWEAVGGGDHAIIFKRPMKKKMPVQYDFAR